MPLSQALRDRVLNELIPKYPTKRAVLTMALWLVQDEQGWISVDSCEEVGALLELDPMDVRAVASFYSMFNSRPTGRHLLEVCHTHACLVNGAHRTMARLCAVLGLDPHSIEHGEATTTDGEYTVRYAECLAACDKPPAVQVNYRYYGPITEQNAEDFIAHMEKYSLEIPIDNPKARPAAGPGYAMSGVQST